MMSVMTLYVSFQVRGTILLSALYRLKKVADPKEKNDAGESIETRLRQRMEREGGIIDSIKRCAKLCDSYQKRHLTGVHFDGC